MNSVDPGVWGPPFWTTMHYIALGYPDRPSARVRDVYRAFFEGLTDLIPCSVCAVHYAQHLRELPLSPGAMASAQALFEWTVALHNLVNGDHGKPAMTAEEAKQRLLRGAAGGDRRVRYCQSGGLRESAPAIVFSFLVGALLAAAATLLVARRSNR